MKQFLKKLLPAPLKRFLKKLLGIQTRDSFAVHTVLKSAACKNLPAVLAEEAAMGLSTEQRSQKLIVVLHATPAEISRVSETVRSVLLQTVKPDRLVLCLERFLFPAMESGLPFELRSLCKFGLEIKWCDAMGEHTPLLSMLRDCPEDVIVTASNAVVYDRQWLELLYTAYLDSVKERKPRICCHRSTALVKEAGGWSSVTDSRAPFRRPTYLHLFDAAAGVLYPPHSLHPDVTDKALLHSARPATADLWYWVMAVRKGTRVKVCNPCYPNPLPVKGVSKKVLTSRLHFGDAVFSAEFKRMLQLYPELTETLDWEWELLHPQARTPEYYASISPDRYEKELEMFYSLALYQDIDMKHPVNHNEKIQWLKLNDATELKARLSDKYEVRQWIRDTVGEEYLIPLIGAYDSADDIDFDALPDAFVLKANHGSGWNLLVPDKSKIDWSKEKEVANSWLQQNYAFVSLELHYTYIKPKLVVEEMLIDEETGHGARDYKVFCFNGKPTYIWVDTGRHEGEHYRDIFDTEWNLMPFNVAKPNSPETPPRPQRLEELVEVAAKLSAGFPMVRVDFYYVNNRIYFGEMTFTPGNGRSNFIPAYTSYVWGDQFKLPYEEAASEAE